MDARACAASGAGGSSRGAWLSERVCRGTSGPLTVSGLLLPTLPVPTACCPFSDLGMARAASPGRGLRGERSLPMG